MKEPLSEPFQTHGPIFLAVEINEGHPNENKQRLFIQSKESAPIACIWLEREQRQAEKWKNYSSKEKASGMPQMEAVGMGKLHIGH